MKVTSQMASKWVKAVFLIILGLVLLMYGGRFVGEMETQSSQQWNMSLDWTWDLVTYLIWILIAWLMVYAVMTIALSFKMDACTIGDVMDRLDRIEKRLAPEKAKAPMRPKTDDQTAPVTVEDEGVPPPPRE